MLFKGRRRNSKIEDLCGRSCLIEGFPGIYLPEGVCSQIFRIGGQGDRTVGHGQPRLLAERIERAKTVPVLMTRGTSGSLRNRLKKWIDSLEFGQGNIFVKNIIL